MKWKTKTHCGKGNLPICSVTILRPVRTSLTILQAIVAWEIASVLYYVSQEWGSPIWACILCHDEETVIGQKWENDQGKSHMLNMKFFTLSPDNMLSKPYLNWISGFNQIMTHRQSLCWKQCLKKIWTVSLPKSQKQYHRHPSHSPWSCHKWDTKVTWPR